MPNTLTWNNVTYHAVTNWLLSDGKDPYANKNLYAAVRFLIGEDSTAAQAHIIAQYAAYAPNGTPTNSNNYLCVRLNSVPPNDWQERTASGWNAPSGNNALNLFLTLTLGFYAGLHKVIDAINLVVIQIVPDVV